MFSIANSRLGVFFAVGVSIIIFLAILFFSFFSIKLLNDFGKSTITLNEETIRAQAENFLIHLVSAHAEKYSSVFQQAETLTSIISEEAAFFLDNIDTYGNFNINTNETFKLYPNGMYSNSATEKMNVIIFSLQGNKVSVKKRVNALSHLDTLLIQTVKNNPIYKRVYVQTDDGVSHTYISRTYPNIHHVTLLPSPYTHDYKNDHYFSVATPEHNPDRKIVTTKIYKDIISEDLMTSVISPIYSKDGIYKGFVGIDITLNTFLNQILGSYSNERYKDEFHFLVDEKTRFISIPYAHLKLFGLETFDPKSFKIGQSLSLSLTKSNHPKVRSLANQIVEHKAGLSILNSANENYMIAYSRIPFPEWSVGIAIPEHVLLDSVQTTRNTLNKSASTMSHQFLFISLSLLIVVIIGTLIFFDRLLFQPIQTLIRFTKNFSQGNTDERITTMHKGEIGSLSTAFNEMAENLQEITVSRDDLEAEIEQRKLTENEKEKVIEELTTALDEIKVLKGIVPICSGCKKIRDDKGYWNLLESYIEKNSEASFSHGMCPECMERYYGKQDWYKKTIGFKP
ncbi:MAG: HAMP domain-containing protein [Proteobacteria bacterium]|nr:HAMP domain-containing protein [Pseudomonadota bacterium]